MKEIKITDDKGIETIYVKKDKVTNTGIGLFREIKYCGFDWNVIYEDNERLRLLMKNCLEIDGDTKLIAFNSSDDECVWWKSSTIRKYLNNDFLKLLNKDDLLPMTTELWLNGESSVTVDKVRMLTIEEIFRLPKNILEKNYWYWSLSPYYKNSSNARMFIIDNNGYLNNYHVNNSNGAAAPVIELKRSVLTEE